MVKSVKHSSNITPGKSTHSAFTKDQQREEKKKSLNLLIKAHLYIPIFYITEKRLPICKLACSGNNEHLHTVRISQICP